MVQVYVMVTWYDLPINFIEMFNSINIKYGQEDENIYYGWANITTYPICSRFRYLYN